MRKRMNITSDVESRRKIESTWHSAAKQTVQETKIEENHAESETIQGQAVDEAPSAEKTKKVRRKTEGDAETV